MLKVGDKQQQEEEEAFFDTAEQFSADYDIWLREPQRVTERRHNFVSTLMGFPQSEVHDLLLQRRNSNSEANCSVDYSDDVNWLDDMHIELEEREREVIATTQQVVEEEDCLTDSPTTIYMKNKKKFIQWLRRSFTRKNDKPKQGKTSIRMQHKHKKYIECTAVYAEQQLKAHNGLIWTMKFSPDGQYLATGGEDGIVSIWRVTTVGPDCANNRSTDASVIIPDKIFHLEEEVVHRFSGHSGDVLDLAWSTSNHLLSASMDKTVRLWHLESEKCLGVFHHTNYVTCVQFNPVDELYFISGSIDGKVRVWGISSGRVEEWASFGDDIVTAVCYQLNGQGFVVGTLSGNCRFYESSGDELLLNAEINMGGKKKSSANKITGIQFLNYDSRRLMITSEDSKIRILDGLEVVRKYKGVTKSGSQMCASLTSSGRHIVSLGEEDSRIYIWNYDDMCIQSSSSSPRRQAKSRRSCENFISQGVSVVLPWLDLNNDAFSSPPPQLASSRKWDSEQRFSLANWFSMDRATWPEEKLPLWDLEYNIEHNKIDSTWGLVFVTGNCDGTIRTFHNYGLPVRV